MKFIVSSVCLLSASLVLAQPTINTDAFFKVGDQVVAYEFSTESQDDGPDGANQVWDFSAVIANGPSDIWSGTVQAPSDTYDSAMFPGANMALASSNGTVRYWSNTENGLVASGQGGDGNLLELEDPSLWMNFPFSYGSSSSDDAQGVIYSSCRDYQWSGTSETHGVGYGTLITPVGTFDNVLKVRRVSFTSKINLETGIDRESNVVEHFWFKPGLSGPLLYMRTWNNNGCPGSNSGAEASYFVPPVINSNQTSNPVIEGLSIAIYPNPARNQAQLSIRSVESMPGQIWLSDMLGQPIMTIDEVTVIEKSNIITLDISKLQPGIYMVNVGTKGQQLTEKLIVQ